MFRTPPDARPNSGANWCVSTLNSRITWVENGALSVVLLVIGVYMTIAFTLFPGS